jgi:DNA replication initiation complex subunit (GINS family)
MISENVPLVQLTGENALQFVLNQIRRERSLKRLDSLPPWFYPALGKVLASLNMETEEFPEEDLDSYLKRKEEARRLETESRILFQLRFSKICRLSVYETESQDLRSMTPAEREALAEYRIVSRRFLNKLLGRDSA